MKPMPKSMTQNSSGNFPETTCKFKMFQHLAQEISRYIVGNILLTPIFRITIPENIGKMFTENSVVR